jgi:outer membrane immunogenic protein
MRKVYCAVMASRSIANTFVQSGCAAAVQSGCAAAFLVAASFAAQAADIARPVYKAAPVAAGYNWTGWYGGLNAGYGWNGATTSFIDDGGAGNTVLNSTFDSARTQKLDPSGFIGGGQLGYNWQFDKQWVAGFETDLQYSAVKGDAFVTPAPGGVTYGLTSRQDLEWFGTVRARLGFLLTERLMAYGTGGLAYGETKASATIANVSGITHIIPLSTQLTCPANSVCIAGNDSRVSAGWTAGGGLEYAPSNNVTFKIEYLHIDLGDQTVRLVAQAPATGNGFVTATFNNAYDIVRAGVNWKF